MKKQPYITTSWDDGSPHDSRLADLLDRYNLPATFYVPRVSQRPTMDAGRLGQLSARFDIGGHTLDHLALTRLSPDAARRQIDGCKAWVQDVTGRECFAFCPPLGKFRREHLRLIRDAGFGCVRTVELLSLDPPRTGGRLAILPTTVQAHPHPAKAYIKNAARRGAAGNLWRYAVRGCPTDWTKLCRSMLEQVLARGGVLHLWGHSWEIEETGQWSQLEAVLRMLADSTSPASRASNSDLCRMLA